MITSAEPDEQVKTCLKAANPMLPELSITNRTSMPRFKHFVGPIVAIDGGNGLARREDKSEM